MKAAREHHLELVVIRSCGLKKSVVTATAAHLARVAAQSSAGTNLAAQLKIQQWQHEAQIQIAGLKTTAAASSESKGFEVEAVENKAK